MEKNIIYNEDYRKTIKRFGEEKIDLILTSPPFLDEEVDKPYYEFLDEFVEIATRISPILLMFNSSRRIVEICRRYEDIQHILIWDKVFTLPAFKYEPIFVITKEKIWGKGRIYRDCLRYLVPRKRCHINENPIPLYRELLRFFPLAKIIYDPFVGSGTTMLAAEEEGRYWIASEIDEKYYNLALSRLSLLREGKLEYDMAGLKDKKREEHNG